ncbi:(d)CMP kinase [Lactobacillus sp. DCY120]|uniref:Cytidylate kinase n=1 Tax=Bombilactobacillus apium TaxID=2675299 RepID=A0A850R8M7_9LACO|nr:(d)CMP kinase [Bombilactobacillus apium]NVY95756.1 (d)CMP kinase [Bombilactobacillus apium]
MQIAIDGPASSGKSTIAKIIAQQLGYLYIDTGAMYRAVTLMAQQAGVAYGAEAEIVQQMGQQTISFQLIAGQQHTFLGPQDVTELIRTPLVANNVSEVSALAKVRQLLVKQQQDLAATQNVVMDGRDIGTVVLPQAPVKIFMTASVSERAQRRYRENLTRNITTSLETLKMEIAARDYKDSHRKISPLKAASDAVHVDTTGLTIEQVVQKILEIIHAKLKI